MSGQVREEAAACVGPSKSGNSGSAVRRGGLFRRPGLCGGLREGSATTSCTVLLEGSTTMCSQKDRGELDMRTHNYTWWLDLLVLYTALAIVVGAVGWFLLGR